MNAWQAVVLGMLQGLTEFLPVSSSGHLVLFESWMRIRGDHLVFEVFVHLGTLVAVLWFFRAKIAELLRSVAWPGAESREKASEDRGLLLLLILATVPGALVGLLLQSEIEAAFSSPSFVGWALLVNGLVLWLTQYAHAKRSAVRAFDSLLIGLAQAVAVLPGISRSGSTISAGLFAGLEGEKAVEFSFLLSIPIILGASIVKAREMVGTAIPPLPIIVGTVCAFVSGGPLIWILMRLIRLGRFKVFAYYSWAIGVVALLSRG